MIHPLPFTLLSYPLSAIHSSLSLDGGTLTLTDVKCGSKRSGSEGGRVDRERGKRREGRIREEWRERGGWWWWKRWRKRRKRREIMGWRALWIDWRRSRM